MLGERRDGPSTQAGGNPQSQASATIEKAVPSIRLQARRIAKSVMTRPHATQVRTM